MSTKSMEENIQKIVDSIEQRKIAKVSKGWLAMKWFIVFLVLAAVATITMLAINFNKHDKDVQVNVAAARAPDVHVPVNVAASRAPAITMPPINVAPAVVNIQQKPPIINIHNQNVDDPDEIA